MIYALIHTVSYEGSDVLGIFTTLPRARAAQVDALASGNNWDYLWIQRHEPDALKGPVWDRPDDEVKGGESA
jgi:hypothetical protein